MGYAEVLNKLKQQAQACKDRAEYLEKQKEIALSTKELSLLIGVNIANVSNKIKRLLIEDKIKVLQGFLKDVDQRENVRGVNNTKYYCLKIEFCEDENLWEKKH